MLQLMLWCDDALVLDRPVESQVGARVMILTRGPLLNRLRPKYGLLCRGYLILNVVTKMFCGRKR